MCTEGGGCEISGSGTFLDLGDAPDADGLRVLRRPFGECEPDPEVLLTLWRGVGGVFVSEGELDLDLEWDGVSSSGVLGL